MKPDDVLKDVGTALTFLLLFSPGFVAMKAYDFWHSAEPRKASDYVYEIIGYSCVNYAVLTPYLISIVRQPKWQENYDLLKYAVPICLIAVPIALGTLVSIIQWGTQKFLNRKFVASTKTAWDWAFQHVGAVGAIVELKDGGTVVGCYEEPAAVSNYPYERDIYLKALWELDMAGNFKNAIAGSHGAYIHGDQIKSIKFQELPD